MITTLEHAPQVPTQYNESDQSAMTGMNNLQETLPVIQEVSVTAADLTEMSVEQAADVRADVLLNAFGPHSKSYFNGDSTDEISAKTALLHFKGKGDLFPGAVDMNVEISDSESMEATRRAAQAKMIANVSRLSPAEQTALGDSLAAKADNVPSGAQYARTAAVSGNVDKALDYMINPNFKKGTKALGELGKLAVRNQYK